MQWHLYQSIYPITVSYTHLLTSETYHHLHTLVEKGDDGDEYNYSPCIDDKEIRINDTKPTVELIEASSIEAKYRLTFNVKVPEKVVNHHRSDEKAALCIVTDISLKANSQTIDFETTIDNHSCDHIVRAVSYTHLYWWFRSSTWLCTTDGYFVLVFIYSRRLWLHGTYCLCDGSCV